MSFTSLNPATGVAGNTYPAQTTEDIERCLQQSDTAFRAWRRTKFAERSHWMRRLAEVLDREQATFGKLMAEEMGKPITAGQEEAAKCAKCARYYAEHTEHFLADEPAQVDDATAFVRYQPLGPVLAIMPWNFPFWQVIRFAAPALMAGNAALLKHASNVPGCALALQDLFHVAGFPEHLFQTLLIGSGQVERVLEDPRVAAVTLTGSENAGRKVGATAGRLIKKSVLELGGSDPFIVMPSADLAAAAQVGVKARTINCGQSCIAAKRFVIHEQVYEEFTNRFVQLLRDLRVGDPLDPTTEVGPLATIAILETLEDQVHRLVEAGARVLTGGKRLPGPGNFYAPTALDNVAPNLPVAQEEIFGPAAVFFRVRNLDDALAVANQTDFGLGASAWTQDPQERERLINEIESGQVFINAMTSSDPRLPFGGIKRSGYGRELARAGIREFVNAKTVYIKGGGA